VLLHVDAVIATLAQSSFQKQLGKQSFSSLLRMVSIFASTISDAGSMSCQMLHVLFVCMMSSDTVTPP
jgi:uncharacterized membrane protein